MKIQIIGVGNVGSTIAFSLIQRCNEVVITDIDQDLLNAQFLDLGDASHIMGGARITKSKEIRKADIYVITAGRNCKIESKKDLLIVNQTILIPYFKSIAEINPDAWVIIATNPSHALAQEGMNYLSKVIPLGSVLDRTRQKRTQLYGKHEEPQYFSKEISDIKGCTQFGVAAECITLINSILGNRL